MFEEACDHIENLIQFLTEKNQAYGNSVGEPVQLFTQLDWRERMFVRMDDKISRLVKGNEYQGDDTAKDLLGYLFLDEALSYSVASKPDFVKAGSKLKTEVDRYLKSKYYHLFNGHPKFNNLHERVSAEINLLLSYIGDIEYTRLRLCALFILREVSNEGV